MSNQYNNSYSFSNDEFAEDELFLREDGIKLCACSSDEKCVHCGFPILPGEEVLELLDNCDIIHRQCWEEFAEENLDLFARSYVMD